MTDESTLATQPAREAQEPVAWIERGAIPLPPYDPRNPTMALVSNGKTYGPGEDKVPLYATPPDAAATIERLQEKVRNLTVLLDQQFGTPCAQIAYAAELASLREKVKADVAAEREVCAQAAEGPEYWPYPRQPGDVLTYRGSDKGNWLAVKPPFTLDPYSQGRADAAAAIRARAPNNVFAVIEGPQEMRDAHP